MSREYDNRANYQPQRGGDDNYYRGEPQQHRGNNNNFNRNQGGP